MKTDSSIKIIILVTWLLIPFIHFDLNGAIPAPKDPKPRLSELNPEFIEYRQFLRNQSISEYNNGYQPAPVDFSHVRGVVDPRVLQTYPERYDLRALNRVTGVRNQGDCGSCWAFGAFASLESCLMPHEEINFSEQHLNRYHGFDYPECGGGAPQMAIAYLSRWDGPISENELPYPYASVASNQFHVIKHVQQVVLLPDRTDSQDNDTIKYFITTYGAVRAGLNYNLYHYNEKTHSLYNANGNAGTTHTIAIVGWDNAYPRTNFKTTPPGDGAFIIKNHDGPYWGENGYFYLSYYDMNLSKMACYNNAEPVENYSTIYQYDHLGYTRSLGYDTLVAWGANVFTATDNKPLKAVSFYLNSSGHTYDIFIYKDLQNSTPTSGTLILQQSCPERVPYPGYYTVPLDQPVQLKAGDTFAVVVRFDSINFNRPLPLEKPEAEYSSHAKANNGESYVSADGISWTDVTTIYGNTNVCIKAFAGGEETSHNDVITTSRNHLNFTAVKNIITTSPQTFRIETGENNNVLWSISTDAEWLTCTPKSGSGPEQITVSVNADTLDKGNYTGTITITSPNAGNSPQTITVSLSVKSKFQVTPPFGVLATPLNDAEVSSSIPVTGWVLDDVEPVAVQIFNGSQYIGDADFVAGARPDVEAAFPDYPMNDRAGWGYMLLTNFLPNGGNGTYTLNAIAIDAEGHQTLIGTSTIQCNNAMAIKPFGAIDTPTQGGNAFGDDYLNWGWVLSPIPHCIPASGNTIDVYVDGVSLGHPLYNQYRSDIATLFPNYCNSHGPVGLFHLDTTVYKNGVHSIHWVATDDAGNTDGIGSRYFTIQNSKNSIQNSKNSTQRNLSQPLAKACKSQWNSLNSLSLSPHRVLILKGFNDQAPLEPGTPDSTGVIPVDITELERIVVRVNLSNGLDTVTTYSGNLVFGDELKPLPIGSSIDRENGIFYWIPGPGFTGNYDLQLTGMTSNGKKLTQAVRIQIHPLSR